MRKQCTECVCVMAVTRLLLYEELDTSNNDHFMLYLSKEPTLGYIF